MAAVTRANVEATKAFIRARLGNPYVYGGALSLNVKQGTDCSEVWQTVLEMVLGRWQQGRQSEGATTESYRYIPVGGVGPFGTIRVNNWRDIPANAVARIAFHHGPGGGANSHMWGELDGMRIESGGSKGLQTGDRALAVESSYATAWAYLPGPIDGVAGPPTPLGIGSTGPEVIALQQRLNTEGAGLEVDGDYGQKTADAVAAWDRRTGYAKTVRDEGVRRGVTPRGIQIAFSVVFVESGWKNYANSKVPESMGIPHDAVGTDYDSVGLFQQRCPMWGPANVLMDPARSAGLFYDRLVKLDYNGSRPAGDYAADIQRPAAEYRGRYQERMGQAVALYTRISTVQPPPTQPTGDDDLSAEAEQILRDLRDALLTPIPSLSPMRLPGEGNVGTLARILRYMDSNIHVQLVIEDAKLGDPDTLDGLNQIINMNDPARAKDVTLAKNILAAARKSWAPAAVAAPAEATEKVDTSSLYAQLNGLQTQNAQLQAENAALRAQLQVPAPVQPSVELAVASPQTTGEHVANVVDSVENWTNAALGMDVKQRAALTASIGVLEAVKNGSQPS